MECHRDVQGGANEGPPGVQGLIDTVVAGGYCIGCGVCAVPENSPLEIVMDEYGRYVARNRGVGNLKADLRNVCPFSGIGPDEDELAAELHFDGCHDPRIGWYRDLFAGYVVEGEFRRLGTSGGMTTWILHELLQRGWVDGIIHVLPRPCGETVEPLVQYGISRTPEEILSGAKSRYYPVELSNVLRQVERAPGRYALVGLPCFIKAVRLLARREKWVRERLVHLIGLVCGHLKSARFAELIGWQLGFPPGSVRQVDFRVKLQNRPANYYGVRVDGYLDGKLRSVTHPMQGLLGSDWGQCLFMYGACDYCDDVFGETADVVVGDAWLPRYTSDPGGTNIVVVRDQRMQLLIQEGMRRGALHLEPLSVEEIVASQAGALRHRREGLAYRLYQKQAEGEWAPRKRVSPQMRHLSRGRRRIYELRSLIASESHEAYRQARAVGQLQVFEARMLPLLRRYQRASASPWRSWARGAVRRFRAILVKLWTRSGRA